MKGYEKGVKRLAKDNAENSKKLPKIYPVS